MAKAKHAKKHIGRNGVPPLQSAQLSQTWRKVLIARAIKTRLDLNPKPKLTDWTQPPEGTKAAQHLKDSN